MQQPIVHIRKCLCFQASMSFRERATRLHMRNRELYFDWPEEARALVRPLLPETPERPLAEREAHILGEVPSEYDHSLDFMVRSPGWDGADERSARIWRRRADEGMGGREGKGEQCDGV